MCCPLESINYLTLYPSIISVHHEEKETTRSVCTAGEVAQSDGPGVVGDNIGSSEKCTTSLAAETSHHQ
jgi:hypothetical protein